MVPVTAHGPEFLHSHKHTDSICAEIGWPGLPWTDVDVDREDNASVAEGEDSDVTPSQGS